MTDTEARTEEKAVAPVHVWSTFGEYEHLVENGKTFRLYWQYRWQTYQNLYLRLELLGESGWNLLEEVYCGDTYYGLHNKRYQQHTRLRKYAEYLSEIGAQPAKP